MSLTHRNGRRHTADEDLYLLLSFSASLFGFLERCLIQDVWLDAFVYVLLIASVLNYSAQTKGGGRALRWARFVRRIIFWWVDFRSYDDWLARRRYIINVICRRTATNIKDCRTNYFRFISKL